MLTEDEIIKYALSHEGTSASHPYGTNPLVLKTKDSHEFCELYQFTNPLHFVLKCDFDKALLLRKKYTSITPGYKCNKKYWNSIRNDGSIPDEQIKQMIDDSYQLACKMKPLKRNISNDTVNKESIINPKAPLYKFDF